MKGGRGLEGNIYHWNSNVHGYMKGLKYRYFRVISVGPIDVYARSLWTGKRGYICINRFRRDFILIEEAVKNDYV